MDKRSFSIKSVVYLSGNACFFPIFPIFDSQKQFTHPRSRSLSSGASASFLDFFYYLGDAAQYNFGLLFNLVSLADCYVCNPFTISAENSATLFESHLWPGHHLVERKMANN